MNLKDSLTNQVAAITGGVGVIGSTFASGLADVGAKVAILDLEEAKATEVAQRISKQHGAEIIGIRCDVLCKDSIQKADQEVADRLGPLALLVNCAGGNSPAATTDAEQISPDLSNLSESFFEIDVEGFRQALDLNLLGTLLPCSIMGRRLAERGGGSIVNISSMNAFRPLTKIPAYSAGKSAVTNFTQWLAVHLAPAKVRVNAIAPGFCLTEQLKYLAFQEDGQLTPRYEEVLANTPMGRFGEPEELVGTLLYLLAAAYRHEVQWSQIIGREVLQSIPYAWWKQFQSARCDVHETVWDPDDERSVEQLRMTFPEYDLVYQVDGMSIDSFANLAATQVTVEQFTGGYRSLVALVEGAMK